MIVLWHFLTTLKVSPYLPISHTHSRHALLISVKHHIISMGQAEDSGEHPCGVCRKGVGDNLILFVKCLRWVHKRCSGISGKLKSNVDFHCTRCLEGEKGLFQSVLVKEAVIEPNVDLEFIPKFCYLGDTLGAGGVEEKAGPRVRCVFWMYREWRMWWGMADWGGLGIWSVGVWMIGYWPVERWRW